MILDINCQIQCPNSILIHSETFSNGWSMVQLETFPFSLKLTVKDFLFIRSVTVIPVGALDLVD